MYPGQIKKAIAEGKTFNGNADGAAELLVLALSLHYRSIVEYSGGNEKYEHHMQLILELAAALTATTGKA